MRNIVAELRALADREGLGLPDEAADEIERLRARMAELEAARGEPVAWRGINELGEVVTDWIDGQKPAQLFDLCGNESGYASYQIAYTAPPAPAVDVDAISDDLWVKIRELGYTSKDQTYEVVRTTLDFLRETLNTKDK